MKLVHLMDQIVRIDPNYFRPTEVETCLVMQEAKKIKWFAKISFKELVKEIDSRDLRLAKKIILNK